ncbi:MAG: hypothetical protein ACREO1_02200 [Arenimonas sp.]
MISLRLYFLFVIFATWFWANSIFAPWATSSNPRLWLYDLLFYTRFVLLFWGAIELLLAWQQIRNEPGKRKQAFVNVVLIGMAVLSVSAYFYLMQTGTGQRLRVRMSLQALAELQRPIFADQRMRAGWFLIDTQRHPCGDQPWLWLGNPYGGGTGNNLVLVFSEGGVPKTPIVEAFRFWQVSDGWWLAYQNPNSYIALIDATAVCTQGKPVDTHNLGMEFIDGPVAN